MQLRCVLLLTPALALFSGSATAQGSGDTPCDASVVPIAGPGSWDYDTATATTQSGVETVSNPCLSAAPPAPSTADGLHFDRWFRWTAPIAGDYVIDTCSPTDTSGAPILNYDTKVAVYRATANCTDIVTGNPFFVACGEDGPDPPCANFSTELIINVGAANTEFWIQVGGWSIADLGPSVLTIDCLGGCPSPFSEGCNGDGGNGIGCTDCPCGNNSPSGTIGGCVNSAGTSSRLLPSGMPVATGSNTMPPLRFECSGVAPSNSAQLTSGNAAAPANAANPCFGLNSGITSVSLDGLRCAVQGVLRHGVRPSDVNGDVGVTTNGWGGSNNLFNFDAFTVGQTKYFQVVHRDDAAQVCGTGQNTTQYVEVTFQ